MSTDESKEIALVISTICCLPTVREPTLSVGLIVSLRWSKSFWVAALIWSSWRKKPLHSRPMKMFWAAVRWFIRLSSWWTIEMPASWASFGFLNWTSLPL